MGKKADGLREANERAKQIDQKNQQLNQPQAMICGVERT
jgi:hypothetical protein